LLFCKSQQDAAWKRAAFSFPQSALERYLTVGGKPGPDDLVFCLAPMEISEVRIFLPRGR